MAIADNEQIGAWVRSARRGDRAAFGRLVRQFQDAVAAVVLARLGPGPDVEDVCQEAFVAAYRQLTQLRDPARFGPWVCGTARNLALRWLRDRRLEAALPAALAARQQAHPSELADRVMAAVADLQERLREPLTLYYIDGYTTDEVANLLQLPPGTVRRRLHEARSRLRERVGRTMEDEIKRRAPAPDFAQTVLDRIAGVRVLGWGTDGTGRVLLVTDEAGRSFSMFVGDREAQALAEALGEKPPSPQPSLYDLIVAVGRRFGLSVQRVAITDLAGGTFLAQVLLAAPAGGATLDVRPSDAINLAVRCRVDVEIAREVTRQAAPDFDDPRPVEEVARVCAGGGLESIDELREQVSADPSDTDARLRLGSLLLRTNIHASYKRPWPLSPEGMAARAVEQFAEARRLLSAVLAVQPRPQQRREALLWLGALAYLEADWQAAVEAFEEHGGPWDRLAWSAAFHFATALHRVGRDQEALARMAEAVGAIDRIYGAEAAAPGRLVARATLANLARLNLGDLTAEARYRALFEPVEPPCILFGWSVGPPFEYGPAFLLAGRPVTIGSGPDADIRVSDPQCAPAHARVYPAGKEWILEDLGSSTGTWSAKRFEKPEALHTGIRIRIGQTPTRSNVLVFLSLREALDSPPPGEKTERAWLVDIAGDQPWHRPVPLVETFRRQKPEKAAAVEEGKPDRAGEPAAELQPGGEPPDCADWPAPWPVCRVAFSGGAKPRLTLTGPQGRQAILSGAVHHLNTVRAILAGEPPQRPMTPHLVVKCLAAGGLTCRHVVLGSPEERGGRVARLQMARQGRKAWFEVHPVDAIAVAFSLGEVPPVWVCEAPKQGRSR